MQEPYVTSEKKMRPIPGQENLSKVKNKSKIFLQEPYMLLLKTKPNIPDSQNRFICI